MVTFLYTDKKREDSLHLSFPESSETNDLKLFLNSGSTYDDNVVARSDILLIKCGLKIPCDIEDYGEFKMAMTQNEAIFKQRILN